jgi:HisA/HisF family protein
MNVIPVIDLKRGVVVRGIAGERDKYAPIESQLASQPTPSAIAAGFAALPVEQVYIADLDAIGGAEPDWQSYRQIAAAGMSMWIDAGIKTLDHAHAMTQVDSLAAVIVALETLASPQMLAQIIAELPVEQLIFSLDLMHGKPLSNITAWQTWSAQQIADYAIELGYRRILVLDLGGVGVGQGNQTEDYLVYLRKQHPEVELISGGGVRNAADLQGLADAGCTSALVASALHAGQLTASDIEVARRM